LSTTYKKPPKANKYKPTNEKSESIGQNTMSASAPMLTDEVLGVSKSST